MKLWFSVQAANKIHHPKDDYGFVPELRHGGYARWLDNWELPKTCGILIDRALGVFKSRVGSSYVVPFCRARPTIYDLFDAIAGRKVMLFVGAPLDLMTDEEFLYEIQWALKTESTVYDTAVDDHIIYDVLQKRGRRVLREPSFPFKSVGRLSTYDRVYPSEVVWMTQSVPTERFEAARKRLAAGLETVVAFRGLTKEQVNELVSL